MDDAGHFYNSHAELMEFQRINRTSFYKANARWWADGGYGGKTDNEAMTGDTDGIMDGEEGLAFLDQQLEKTQQKQSKFLVAVDVGAGLGRITKIILLKRYQDVHLVEGDEFFSNQSKVYLGKKRSQRCTFTHCALQDLSQEQFPVGSKPLDLVWIQWCLQYLTDLDVVECLKLFLLPLRPTAGLLIVKENRPYGGARIDRFQMETPLEEEEGAAQTGRYDITRTDAQHRLLFRKAGFRVDSFEQNLETNTYSLKKQA